MPLEPVRFLEIAAWFERTLGLPPDGDAPTVWREPAREGVREGVRCLGLALEPRANLDPRTNPEARACDAVFFHRPFRLGASAWKGAGVLAAHANLDAKLTTGFNEPLAARLGMRDLGPLHRDGMLIGMVGTLEESQPWASLEGGVAAQFGGLENTVQNGVEVVSSVAVCNAMTPALIEDAARHGATAFVTGQVRKPGVEPAARLGVGVIAVGARRTELWALRWLERALRDAFPTLEVRPLEQ